MAGKSRAGDRRVPDHRPERHRLAGHQQHLAPRPRRHVRRQGVDLGRHLRHLLNPRPSPYDRPARSAARGPARAASGGAWWLGCGPLQQPSAAVGRRCHRPVDRVPHRLGRSAPYASTRICGPSGEPPSQGGVGRCCVGPSRVALDDGVGRLPVGACTAMLATPTAAPAAIVTRAQTERAAASPSRRVSATAQAICLQLGLPPPPPASCREVAIRTDVVARPSREAPSATPTQLAAPRG